MLTLFLLLLIPLAIGVTAFLKFKELITIKEFCIQEIALAAVVATGYFVALSNQTADTEIWSGRIAAKAKNTIGCCHSYECHCKETCTGEGENRSCSETCETCYEHSHDVEWEAVTTNGETAYHNGCNAPYTPEPKRWTQIIINEPTAIPHGFVNYIKGNPDSIMRREGVSQSLLAMVPRYPEVYDHYRAQRFLVAGGASVPDVVGLNQRLSDINSDLGNQRQVNITVIIVKTDDQMYLEAVNQAWLGGKKNDLITVVGVRDAPGGGEQEIVWAGVVSWTKIEEIKISIRDAVVALKVFDGKKVLEIVRSEVQDKFVRRDMSDFEYLKATIRPPVWAMWFLGLFGIILSLGLTWYFKEFDPFHDRCFSFDHARRNWR